MQEPAASVEDAIKRLKRDGAVVSGSVGNSVRTILEYGVYRMGELGDFRWQQGDFGIALRSLLHYVNGLGYAWGDPYFPGVRVVFLASGFGFAEMVLLHALRAKLNFNVNQIVLVDRMYAREGASARMHDIMSQLLGQGLTREYLLLDGYEAYAEHLRGLVAEIQEARDPSARFRMGIHLGLGIHVQNMVDLAEATVHSACQTYQMFDSIDASWAAMREAGATRAQHLFLSALPVGRNEATRSVCIPMEMTTAFGADMGQLFARLAQQLADARQEAAARYVANPGAGRAYPSQYGRGRRRSTDKRRAIRKRRTTRKPKSRKRRRSRRTHHRSRKR